MKLFIYTVLVLIIFTFTAFNNIANSASWEPISSTPDWVNSKITSISLSNFTWYECPNEPISTCVRWNVYHDDIKGEEPVTMNLTSSMDGVEMNS